MKHFHFIGIGGIGMSGLAQILLQQGIRVTGSDARLGELTNRLQQQGAVIFEGHRADQVPPGCTVVYTSQVTADNPELTEAKKRGCLLLHRSELLALLSQEKKILAVAGTHGKTTTTALLTSVLVRAGWDPAYAIGGVSNDLPVHARWGNGGYFVLEADESDGSFLRYNPYGAIVTNIDNDHLDHYGSEQKLIEAFGQFILSLQNRERLLWCGDDVSLGLLRPFGDSYGVGKECFWQVSAVKQRGWETFFDLHTHENYFNEVCIRLAGAHNALNAAAVFALAYKLGVPEETIRQALERFSGVGRRAEKVGIINDILVIDDYGHHPTEIKATLQALRQAEPSRRLVVVFQPHRYSRTLHCLDSFGSAFVGADMLFITDIYGAFEPPIAGIDAATLLRKVQQSSHVSCRQVGRADLLKAVVEFVRPHDAVVTLGAGDITHLGPDLLSKIRNEKF